MDLARVSQLWRYPVKSLRGAALDTARLTLDGGSGDRVVHVAGHDIRRLRPNIVLSGMAADLEPDLPGQALAIGDALIGVHSVCRYHDRPRHRRAGSQRAATHP